MRFFCFHSLFSATFRIVPGFRAVDTDTIMKTNILIPGVALAIGLGVGFGVGKNGGDAEGKEIAAAGETRTRSGVRGMDRDGESARDKKVRSVDEIYRKPGQSNRAQALLDFYSNLSPDQFQSEAEKL